MSFSGARCLLPGASRAQRGFTLVEMIVAIGLFAVVMIVCVGALLSLVHANRKAQALQSVMNNLNIALDGMVRSIRMGNDYRCDALNPEDGDCPTGGRSFYFESFVGQSNTTGDDWIYFYDAAAQRIYKSTDGSLLSGIPLTAPEVSIDEMLFYVIGTNPSDTVQPKVVIVVNGSVGAVGVSERTTFHIQATAVQRVLDL